MKKLLLFIAITLTAYSSSAEVIKFDDESIKQYQQQVKYNVINQLLKSAYKGKLKLLDENNQPLNLKLKADTLWMGAVRYSFEADEYYTNYSAQSRVKSVRKVWVHESNSTDIAFDDKYAVITFYTGAVWLDKRNQLIVKIKKNELLKLIGAEGIQRLTTDVSFYNSYKTLYDAAYNKTGVVAYKSSSLKTPLNETVLNEAYYKPVEEKIVHDDRYPDDPFMLIDTLLPKKVILLIDTEQQGAVGFTIDNEHEIWFKKEKTQFAEINLLLKQYYINKKAGYVCPFMYYSGVTPAVLAKSSSCISTYIDTTNKEEIALMKKIYDIIESDKINIARSVDSFLSTEATAHDIYLLWEETIKQVQDPLYPDDPYMVIDTTILTQVPLVFTSYYNINDTLYSIGFTGVGYEQQFVGNYKVNDGTIYIERTTHLIWLNAYMLKVALTEEQWLLLMDIYKRAKQE